MDPSNCFILSPNQRTSLYWPTIEHHFNHLSENFILSTKQGTILSLSTNHWTSFYRPIIELHFIDQSESFIWSPTIELHLIHLSENVILSTNQRTSFYRPIIELHVIDQSERFISSASKLQYEFIKMFLYMTPPQKKSFSQSTAVLPYLLTCCHLYIYL